MAANIDFSTVFNFVKCLLQKITLGYLVIRHPLKHRCQEIWAVLEKLELVLELLILFLKQIVAIIVLEGTEDQDYEYERHNYCFQSCAPALERFDLISGSCFTCCLTRYHIERGLPFDRLVELSFFATRFFQHLRLMGSAFLCGILDLQSAPAVFSYGR